jgi:hypothetical protein
LTQVLVNSSDRWVGFGYDSDGRLQVLQDHTGRSVLYTYDDGGYLDRVSGPGLPGETPERSESYEYDQVGYGYKLARVRAWDGQLLVENEYERDPRSDFFGFVTRQTENQGETSFFYEKITGQADPTRPVREVPTLRVWEGRRNGHQIEHILNRFGNELSMREELVDGGQVRERLSLYRYNADGQVTDTLDAEGALTQSLYRRDDLAGSLAWPDLDPVLSDVTMGERMSFGNLLATVTRGRRVGPGTPRDLTFWDTAPDVKAFDSADDIITKYTFDPISQLLLTRSDPRFTVSADPLHVESSPPGYPNYDPNNPRYIAHQRHLTRFEFGPGPRFELRQTVFPDRSVGGVTTVRGIVERYTRYDNNGRLLERVDPRGYEWVNIYYPSSADPAKSCKEGYLQGRLLPHLDWPLNDQSPPIIEVRTAGAWQATPQSLLSGGAAGDLVTLAVEGARVILYQSSDLASVVSSHDRVRVAVDGNACPDWDQTAAASYLVDGLGPGPHIVVVSDDTGVRFALGRVRTHVCLAFQVDGLGRVLVATDARGLDAVNVVDALGRKTRVTRGPATNPSVVEYTYNPADHLIRVRTVWRDEEGHDRPEKAIVKRYDYDPGGLLLMAATGPEQPGQGDRTSGTGMTRRTTSAR